jgi:hypothetical protein
MGQLIPLRASPWLSAEQQSLDEGIRRGVRDILALRRPAMNDVAGAGLSDEILLAPSFEIVLGNSTPLGCEGNRVLVELCQRGVDAAELGEMLERDF